MNAQTMEKYDKYLTNNYPIDISYFEEQLILNPSSIYLKLMKIYFLMRDQDINEAKLGLSKLDAVDDSSNADLYYMIKGLFSFIDENREQAKENFELALSKEHEKNKWLRLELFFFYIEVEDYLAFGYLDEAINIDPNFNEAIVQKCNYLDSINNCNEIILNLEKIPPTYHSTSAMNLLGVAYSNCGEIEKGIDILKKSIKDESSSENNFSLAYIYSNFYKDIELAEAYYEKSLEIDDTNLDAINGYAWLLYEKKDYQSAEKKFISAISLNKDQSIYDQIIQFYLLRHDFEKAKIYIEESRKLNGSDFTNEGLEIVRLLLSKGNYAFELENYKNKYGEFEINWLKEIINELMGDGSN